MKADPHAQRSLLDLQDVDTAIAQLEHRRKALPEHAAIAEAQRERARLGESIIAARTVVSDLELQVQKAERDLVPVRERRVRDQQRLDNGVVSDPKALQALIDEIAHLGQRISDLEDAELELMDTLEQATAEHDALVTRRQQGEGSLRELLATRDQQLGVLDAELAAHQARRAEIAGGLPADLVTLYDRIRARSGGRGAALLKGRRCGGCQLEVTPMALARFVDAGEDEVLRCEECDRILVREGPVA